jgi:hypothetical protein
LLILTVPNFSGFFQYFYHLIFDYANLKKHNISSMNPEKWINYIKKKGYDCQIIFSGSFGKIDFWVDQIPSSNLKKSLLKKVNKFIQQISKRNLKNSNLYSPYLGLIINIER